MAQSTIDGTVEEAVLRRRRSQGSFYDSIKFRLDDGSTKTWTKAHVMNNVGDLLTPGTRGRFYLFTAIDHRGVSGIRTDDGREAFGVARLNEQVADIVHDVRLCPGPGAAVVEPELDPLVEAALAAAALDHRLLDRAVDRRCRHLCSPVAGRRPQLFPPSRFACQNIRFTQKL